MISELEALRDRCFSELRELEDLPESYKSATRQVRHVLSEYAHELDAIIQRMKAQPSDLERAQKFIREAFANDPKEWWVEKKVIPALAYEFAAIRAESAPAQPVHGVNCLKVDHAVGISYGHAPDDDGTYDIDGVLYCGRCHAWIELPPRLREKGKR